MQNLSIQGLINARDLGGAVAADGRMIRTQKMVRSDALNDLTEAGIVKLHEYGLHTIIDLRTETERNEKPDAVVPGIDMFQIPIFKEDTAGITREQGSAAKLIRAPDMKKLYRHMVSDAHSISQLAKVIRTIMAVDDGCVLFHCTAGKDRTGVVAMLLLGILGTSEDDILEDYIYTNATGADVAYTYRDMVLQKTGNAEMAESVIKAFLADKEYLLQAMSVVEECGGYDSFFCSKLQISADDIKKFREMMLE